MLMAKRILVVIAIVLCLMQTLDLFVQVIRPKKEATSPWTEMKQMLNLKGSEIVRRTIVWYIGGLVALLAAVALTKTQPWLHLSFGIGGVGAMLIGCSGGALFGISGISALLMGGVAFAGSEFLWPRFVLSLLTLAILSLMSVCLSRDGRKL
jgi:hypothetical protein